MNGNTVHPLFWAGALGRACEQGTVVLLVIWAVCRLLPRLPGGLRCGLWWLACLKLLAGLVWVAPVSIALLPAPPLAADSVPPGAHNPTLSGAARYLPRDLSGHRLVPGSAASPCAASGIPPHDMSSRHATPPRRYGARLADAVTAAAGGRWAFVCLLLWGLGVAARLILFGRDLYRVHCWVGDAEDCTAPATLAAARDLACRLGLRRMPRLRLSRAAVCPLAVGLARPTVLLPRELCETLDLAPVRLALAHEMAHLRRGDLWLGWVPAIAQTLFFFHPLVWLACREYLQAREEACDAAALRLTGAAPHEYGRLLLRFGVVVAPPTALAASGTAPSFVALQRRLLMLGELSSPPPRLVLSGAAVTLVLFAVSLVPLRVVAQTAKVAGRVSQTGAPTRSTFDRPHPLSAARPADRGEASNCGLPVASLALPRNGKTDALVFTWKRQTYPDGPRSGVLPVGEGRTRVRHSGHDYVITDPATVRAVRGVFDGAGRLDRQQGELGRRQVQRGQKQWAWSPRAVARASQAGHTAGTPNNQDALRRRAQELSDRQDALARLQRALGQRQAEAAAQAEAAIQPLIDQALARGMARDLGTSPAIPAFPPAPHLPGETRNEKTQGVFGERGRQIEKEWTQNRAKWEQDLQVRQQADILRAQADAARAFAQAQRDLARRGLPARVNAPDIQRRVQDALRGLPQFGLPSGGMARGLITADGDRVSISPDGKRIEVSGKRRHVVIDSGRIVIEDGRGHHTEMKTAPDSTSR